ncbi:MAG TPA: hydrolase [Candidatus Fimivivens faecavium]|nr:hydrolase [Candidatus Fimivivens faecavium]
MELSLYIQHGDALYEPCVEEDISFSLERKGSPGKLAFRAVDDGRLPVSEGDQVLLKIGGVELFYGFVFTLKRNQTRMIDITAYDQLRYLKNKDTIIDGNLTASELIRRIGKEFSLSLGVIEDTGFVLESVIEDNQTLFDIIQGALDETLQATGRLYVMYDDYGYLTLRSIENLRLGLLLDEETAQGFDYSSSIDNGTANRVKLAFDDEKAGTCQIYQVQNGDHINEWGVLQYFEKINSPAGAVRKAETLLRLYDQKTKKLSVKGAFGDPRVRAGTGLAVSLALGGETVSQLMVVERVTHRFRQGAHLMDLDLIGGDFFG